MSRSVRSSLEKAVEEGLITRNPSIGCKLPPKKNGEMKVLTQNEIVRLLNQAYDEGYYEMFLLELTTGMRRGEILGLKWRDLNLETGELNIKRQLTTKGVSVPKTKSSIRTIKLCDECIRLLSELKANQIPKSKYIFPSSITGEIRDTSAVTRRLHRIQDRAGVPRIRFHDLRHSFATLSLEQGMDIKTVSHMLGHTDAGFTMNTYMHVTDSMQENVANTMGNLLGGNATNL